MKYIGVEGAAATFFIIVFALLKGEFYLYQRINALETQLQTIQKQQKPIEHK